MRKEYIGCNALVCDDKGVQLANVRIKDHDDMENSIEVEYAPALAIGSLCDVMILMAPVPHTYKGRIHKRAGKIVITLFKGGETENRHELRYKLDITAHIESLICDGKAYPLLDSVETKLIDISQSGIRLRSRFHAMSDGDRFQIRLKAGGNDKLLVADVIYHKDSPPEYSEFGCHLVGEEID